MSLFLRRLCCFRIPPSFPYLSTANRTLTTQFQFGTLRLLNGFSITHQSQCPLIRCQLQSPRMIQTRGVVNCSKRQGKKKSVKAVAKRFHRTGSGKLKYWPAGKVHNMLSKSRNHRRRLKKPRYATKTQLKTLNKMISGW